MLTIKKDDMEKLIVELTAGRRLRDGLHPVQASHHGKVDASFKIIIEFVAYPKDVEEFDLVRGK
jgi:hypothetical protein